MECSGVRSDGKLIVRVQGRLDVNTVAEFDRQLKDCLEPGDINVTLDLSQLDFITSAGLRSVLALHKTLKAREGQLVLCGLKNVVAEVFAISGLSFVLPIYGTLDEALVGR